MGLINKVSSALVAMAFLCLSAATALARIYIPIDQPSNKRLPIAVCDLKGGGGFGEEVAAIIRNDLILSGYFQVINPEVFKKHADDEGATVETVLFSFWKAIEAQALVKGVIERKGGKFVVGLRLFDPYAPELLVGKEYTVDSKYMRDVAHRFSDEIMEALTGIRGVFTTQIAYAAPVGGKHRDIAVMDMDGERKRLLAPHKSYDLSPSWSPDGKQIVFTSYRNGLPDLYLTNLGGKEVKRLTFGPGVKLAPAWSPRGDVIVFSSSASGESELVAITPQGKDAGTLTQEFGIDIGPAFSPDGSEIVFSSERAGGLHVFKMPASGGGAQRLTFVGYQNDMPAWSPRADKIAFSGRDEGTFDIFIMNTDGSNIQRLTVRSGSNENPSFSPDGRYLTFSSTRDGRAEIYIMRIDGSNQTRITKDGGVLPAWGPQTRE